MTAKVELSGTAEDKLSKFASSLLMNPKTMGYAPDILGLRSTFKGADKLPVDVRNQLVEKMNRDPDGTIKQAQVMIDKNPAILKEFNKDPMKLAEAMGVKPTTPAPAPVAGAPAKTAPQEPVPPTKAPARAANKPELVAALAPAQAAGAPSRTDSALTPAQMTEAKILEVHGKIMELPGYKDLMSRAEKDPSLDRALTAIRNGKEELTPDQTLKRLTDFHDKAKADPEFFKKAVDMIDKTPPHMREGMYAQIAADPDLGMRAISGDSGAQSTLTMNSLFGGTGGLGKGGLAGIFGSGGIASIFSGGGSGGGLQGFGQMIANLLPRLFEGLMEFVGKMSKGASSFAAAPGLMIDGKGQGIMLGRFANSVDSTLGTDSSQKPVITASKPDEPAKTIGDLAKPKPENEATPVPGTPTMAQLDRKVISGGPQNPGQTGGSFA